MIPEFTRKCSVYFGNHFEMLFGNVFHQGRNTHFIENHVISQIFINHLYGIENKPWFNFIWRGQAPPPPPPHQYASDHEHYDRKFATGAYFDKVVSLLEYVGYGRHVQRCYISP